MPRLKDANLLVGFDTHDDAGVYRISPECALVQTTDFFTPIVDDPFTFGAIAAANALSDVYAMGGRPLTALSILCYPAKGDLEDLEAILRGGAEKMIEAGCVVLGGHSVSDEEIKFGYAVTGTIHPDQIKTNAGARPGDALVLTKPIGTGVISTALKRGIARDEDVEGSVTIEIDWRAIEFLPGALDYSEQGALSGGLKNNRAFAECAVLIEGDLPEPVLQLLYDPQTSGGLLIALPEESVALVPGRRIGRVVERREKPIVVK